MNIIKAISSVHKAFSLFLGLSPRTFTSRAVKKPEVIKHLRKFRIISPALIQAHRIHKFQSKPIKNNESRSGFLQVLSFPVEGPEIKRYHNLVCQIIHRVAVRSVVQALHTTESRELSESEFELINTTHSSFIDSEDSRV